jgi:hypothetical protein
MLHPVVGYETKRVRTTLGVDEPPKPKIVCKFAVWLRSMSGE